MLDSFTCHRGECCFNIYVERKSMTADSDSSNSDDADIDDGHNEIDYDTSIDASNERN